MGPSVKAGSRATSPKGDARHVREYRRGGEGTWAGMLDGTGDTEGDGEARPIRDMGRRWIGETGDGTWTREVGCGGTAVTDSSHADKLRSSKGSWIWLCSYPAIPPL